MNLNLTDQNLALSKKEIECSQDEFLSVSLASDFQIKQISSEVIEFQGHENILGTHYNTLEMTTYPTISKRADCIIGVNATKSCATLDDRLVSHVKSNGKMVFVVSVGELNFSFNGFGSQDLPLSDEKEIVLRKSDFISPRTLAIHCDAAAIDLPREMISALQNPRAKGRMEIKAVEGSPFGEVPSLELL